MALIDKKAVDKLIMLSQSNNVGIDDIVSVQNALNNAMYNLQNQLNSKISAVDAQNGCTRYVSEDITDLGTVGQMHNWSASLTFPTSLKGGIILPYALAVGTLPNQTKKQIVATSEATSVADFSGEFEFGIPADSNVDVEKVYIWALVVK